DAASRTLRCTCWLAHRLGFLAARLPSDRFRSHHLGARGLRRLDRWPGHGRRGNFCERKWQMTARQGLWMTWVGSVILLLGVIAAYLFPHADSTPMVLLYYLSGGIGPVVMIVGLVIAAVGALTKSTP